MSNRGEEIMTVQDIKDYMDEIFEDYLNDKIGRYTFIGKMCKVRDMLDQVDEPKISIDDIASKMRPATKEELEGIDEYIKEISVAIDDE